MTDTTSEGDVARLFDRAMAPRNSLTPIDLVAYNAGNNRRIDFREMTPSNSKISGGSAVSAAFWSGAKPHGGSSRSAAARSSSPVLQPACAVAGLCSVRRGQGRSGMIAQSMAREYGPQGIHVAHVIIDGGIDGERLRAFRPQIVKERGEDGMLNIDAIAEIYWQVHRQHPVGMDARGRPPAVQGALLRTCRKIDERRRLPPPPPMAWPAEPVHQALSDALIDADTICKISGDSFGSSTARAMTRAPTMLAKVAMAFFRFAAADFPGVAEPGTQERNRGIGDDMAYRRGLT